MSSMPYQVAIVPALTDNYIWLLHDSASGSTAVVDPGDGAAALAGAAARGWTIDQVLITHWHPDHTAGIGDVVAATGAKVWGPEAERDKFAGLDHGVGEGDSVAVGPWRAAVWHVPGHTLGHIAFHFAQLGLIMVGDTMFAMGCGRLFEGTPTQMHESLQRIAGLPGETLVYGAHEYTLSNAKFARHIDPDNASLAARVAEVERLRGAGQPTLPTTVAIERATNPFVRAIDAAEFTRLRALKDNF